MYVANSADGDLPGTLSVIDSATCNGTDTTGCTQPHPTATVGNTPLNLAIDTVTDRIYVSDFGNAAVSIVNGSTCNATVTTGCSTPAPE